MLFILELNFGLILPSSLFVCRARWQYWQFNLILLLVLVIIVIPWYQVYTFLCHTKSRFGCLQSRHRFETCFFYHRMATENRNLRYHGDMDGVPVPLQQNHPLITCYS